MSFDITTAFVQQYTSGIMLLSQQKGSRLRPCVFEEAISGEAAYQDQVGATEAVERTSRHADTPLVSTPHARRKVFPATYDWADLIDHPDKVRTLNDPTNFYVRSGAFALGRKADTVILNAMIGTAYTGKTGATPVALPSSQKVAVSASALTLAKLLAAKEILDAGENDPEEERFIALRAADVTSLLNTTEVKSSDYNTVKALASGEIDTFLGFKFKRTQLVPNISAGGNRAVIAWRKNAVWFAPVAGSQIGRITERADKNYSVQVFASEDFGATRLEDVGVVEIAVNN